MKIRLFCLFVFFKLVAGLELDDGSFYPEGEDVPGKEEVLSLEELLKFKCKTNTRYPDGTIVEVYNEDFFRLEIGEESCNHAVHCTINGTIEAIRCPPGLYFDLAKQTCAWKWTVTNCDVKTKSSAIIKPLLNTEEPLCYDGYLSCGDWNCIEKNLFCNGVRDCQDGADENYCGVGEDPNGAPKCDELCKLPDCFCSVDGTKVPGDMCFGGSDCQQVPQMITISFTDAINKNNIDMFNNIFNNERKNPNGCSIKGTFFVSHKHTDYTAVHALHSRGHEIAAHSISHNNDDEYWSNGSVDSWTREMAGSKLITEKFANITDNHIVGLRAPKLMVGGNNQFTMMEEQSYVYDSSIIAPLQNPPVWPYSMHFQIPHKCNDISQKCPTRSKPVWEMVLNELDRREDPSVDKDEPGCAIIDSCSNIITGDQFYNFLNHNFYRHFNQNRAPLGLSFHSAWLKKTPELYDTFLYWIDEILEKHPEVYFTTMSQIIQWIKNPVGLDSAKDFAPWQVKCSAKPQETCQKANRCLLSISNTYHRESIEMSTCIKCPKNYPWLYDPLGNM